MISTNHDSNLAAAGKFFSRRGSKFFFKAIRIETPTAPIDFPTKLALRKRFDKLAQAHTTAIVISEKEAEPLLGIAALSGLQALAEIAVSFEAIARPSTLKTTAAQVVHTATRLRGCPALSGYLLDFAIDPDLLRHRGIAPIQKRLRQLMRSLRHADPERLIAIKHRPATVGLSSLDEDLIYAEAPDLTPGDLRQYVIRLHNLAEARPVVLEFGEELPGQDELVAYAFGLGVAGVVAPAMRPAASSGRLGVRMLSAGELLPFVSLNGSCPPQPLQPPMVSVVICAYNAERTMRPCLESLRKLDYPNFEVVIVDDGSRDRTAEVAQDFPEFRLIRQPNKGLSVARNVGMHAAHGELIAYTDSDCVVDPHWLTFMVRAIAEQGFDGCGGPNYAPHEEGWVEAACAASPGAPCHVLVGTDRAEHLAGCNMVYRKAALDAIGGFDPQFTAAGDDVDVCWRMLDAGFTLGYSPAAFVWHFRRNTVQAYYGQQRGYGKAEAMLYPKYPERFNALGQIRWQGTIPGLARTFPGGARNRLEWTRRRTDMQNVAEVPLNVLRVLPLTAEWNAGAMVAFALSLGLGITLLPALLMLLLGPCWAFYYAANAPLEKCHRSFKARMLIAWLAYSGPIARTLARYRHRKGARGRGRVETPPRQRPTIDLTHRALRLAYWNESWTTRDQLLERIARLHSGTGRPVLAQAGWSDSDLMIEPGALTKLEIKTADEEHSGNRIKNHVAIRGRLTSLTRAGLIIAIVLSVGAALLGFHSIAAVLGVVVAGVLACALAEFIETARLAYRIVEQATTDLGLSPLGSPTLAARRSRTPARKPDETTVAAQPAQQ